jgi:hypothetical protein
MAIPSVPTLAACALLALLVACAGGQVTETSTAAPSGELATWEVGPELVPCTGVAPQDCMRVRDYPDGEWRLFYDQIAGFDYEPGFVYVIDVAVTPVPSPPADASSLLYTLVRIVSREPS